MRLQPFELFLNVQPFHFQFLDHLFVASGVHQFLMNFLLEDIVFFL